MEREEGKGAGLAWESWLSMSLYMLGWAALAVETRVWGYLYRRNYLDEEIPTLSGQFGFGFLSTLWESQ